jgi:hypothetical protein
VKVLPKSSAMGASSAAVGADQLAPLAEEAVTTRRSAPGAGRCGQARWTQLWLLAAFTGPWPAILVTGVAFGLAHGLVLGLPVLTIFGITLGWLRWQTGSVYPGMIAHGLFNGAALLAARQGKEAVGMADFDEAIDRVVAGLKKTRVMSAKEREIVATHEAGHAVAAELLPGSDPVSKVSIVSRGIAALGYTQQLPTEDRYLMTRSELFNRLCVLLGGRTAEEIVFGDVSTGAQNDLQRATDLVRHMVAQYGMSDKVGLMTFDGGGRPALFPGLSPPREHSEETARLLDAEAGRILGEAHVKVSALLTDQRSLLEQLARRLLEKEVVEGDELHALLAGATASRVGGDGPGT